MNKLRQGMNLGADDYITKPYNPVELLKILETRIQLNINRNEFNVPACQTESEKLFYEDTFFIFENDRLISVRVKDIVAIKAENTSSNIMLIENKKLFSNKLLKFWENKLPEKHFIRIHKSNIINISHNVKIDKWFNNTLRIHLENYPEPIDASRRYSSILKKKYIV